MHLGCVRNPDCRKHSYNVFETYCIADVIQSDYQCSSFCPDHRLTGRTVCGTGRLSCTGCCASFARDYKLISAGLLLLNRCFPSRAYAGQRLLSLARPTVFNNATPRRNRETGVLVRRLRWFGSSPRLEVSGQTAVSTTVGHAFTRATRGQLRFR